MIFVARCWPQNGHRLVQLPTRRLLGRYAAKSNSTWRSGPRRGYWWICCCPGQAWQPPCKACARTVGVWGCWPGHWLFFMELVPQRDAATLVPIIQRLILPGSTVWSDEWAAYNQLNAYVVYIRYSLHMHNVVWSVVYIINLLHFTQGCVYNIGVLYICAVSSLQFLVLPVARVPSTRAILDVWRNQCD